MSPRLGIVQVLPPQDDLAVETVVATVERLLHTALDKSACLDWSTLVLQVESHDVAGTVLLAVRARIDGL